MVLGMFSNILKRNNLVNVVIYVVRIYGGVNLGIPGLIHAYSTSASHAIKDAFVGTLKMIIIHEDFDFYFQAFRT